MYHYYTYDGRTLCSAGALPYPEISALPETGEVLWVFHRPPLAGRDTFPVTDPAQLTEEEGVASLCTAPCPEDVPPALRSAIRAGRVRAVNGSHPRLEELLAPVSRPEKVRVNLLALGDVGSTLLLGLRLMGGDVISSIGICDLREGVARRWEFELNQIQLPGPYDALPPVEIVPPERLFDGDVFLFSLCITTIPMTAAPCAAPGPCRTRRYPPCRRRERCFGCFIGLPWPGGTPSR